MKFLSSSPSSSASTSDSTSFNPKNANSGSLIGILRRLLCFNALPTHPFDQIRKVENEAKWCGERDHVETEEAKFDALCNPGIVARLMGLESMPGFDLDGTPARPNAITRSQSMNYAASRREEVKQGKHRRIKSTLSFREVPSFVELETEEFFILSFEGGGKDDELVLKSRKSDMRLQESKQKRTDKCSSNSKTREHDYENNKENEVPNVVSSDGQVEDPSTKFHPRSMLNQNSHVTEEAAKLPKPICRKQRGERRRSRRKKRKENCSPVQKVEAESESENSSPVSVLDYVEFPLEAEVASSEEDLRLKDLKYRRKLSRQLESYELTSPPITNDSNNNGGKADKSKVKCSQSWKHDHKFQNYAEMCKEICRLTNKETILQSDRMYKEMRQLEYFEDIGAAVGLEILDQLISEFNEL